MSAESPDHSAPSAPSAAPHVASGPAPDAALDAARHSLEVLGWRDVAQALARECSSAEAARVAEALLPDLDLEAARLSLAETEEARRLLAEDGIPVAGVRDVTRAIDLASRGGRLDPADLADVARTVEAFGRLVDALAATEVAAPLLSARAASIAKLPDLVRSVDRAIDEHGKVREDASARLQELHRQKAGLARAVEARIEALRRDPEIAASLTDDYVTVREDRHVLPVRADRRSRVPGILHGRSGSGQSVFVEPQQLVELNNDLRGVGFDIEEEIDRILRELAALVGRHAAEIRSSLDAHRIIDLARARGVLADRMDATTPALGVDAPLALVQLAHPLLVLLRRSERGRGAGSREGRTDVVRNDVHLAPPALGIVISGPNAGGKTVLLKAVGLACLMARAGLPVACDEGSSVPFLDAVLADIGDEQSIERSLSSFTGHLAVLRGVLETCARAPGRCLVLLDEIMAGTDPAEGAPLAQSVLEELARREARVIVTTHLGSLKAFASASGRFVNAGMEFDESTLRATYRVRIGLPGASAALRVAERFGLPRDVVTRAEELAGTAQVTAEKLLHELDAARADAERARDETRRALADATRRRSEYESKLAALARRDEHFVRDERAAFERELRELREQAAEVTRQLQQAPAHAPAADAVRKLEELKARSREAAARATGAGGGTSAGSSSAGVELEAGMRVKSASMDRVGTVLSPPDARGRVRVAFGPITMVVGSDDLVSAAGMPVPTPGAISPFASKPSKPAGKERSRRTRAPADDDDAEARARAAAGGGAIAGAPDAEIPFTPQSPRNTCDLRGMRVDEALSALSSFLERARSTSERSVVIIHGHGTGALKAAVREELRGEARVGAIRPGGNGEGGDGVTVAMLG